MDQVDSDQDLAESSISPFSTLAYKIELKANGHSFAVGTAFCYQWKGKNWLVTNWHNVTGREPASHKTKSSLAVIPDSFSIHLVVPREKIGKAWGIETLVATCELYKDADFRIPWWFEHPVHKDGVDLVVLPWPEGEYLGYDSSSVYVSNCTAVNDPRLGLSKGINLRAGTEVFTLGFPQGLDGEGFPIWKRGSISTEPGIDIGKLPLLYIDTATREGMSGSPVFACPPVHFVSPEQVPAGVGRVFLGVYSGRVGDDTFLAQLGKVWKEKAIIETIEGGCVGRSSHWDL